MRSRIKLVQYRQATIAPDVAEAMRQLEMKAAQLGGVKLQFQGLPKSAMDWTQLENRRGPTGCKPPWSMVPAGREIYLRLRFEEGGDNYTQAERELATLWGLAIPLGFTPWKRYPLSGEGDGVFHYLGPWQILYDHLLSLGRGEEAWPSVTCAAQVDAGMWGGPNPTERFIQAQLHRIGINVGPIDGQIGDVTIEGLRHANLHKLSLPDAADKLVKMQLPEPPPDKQHLGHVVIPGKNLSIVCTGGVSATRTKTGAALNIMGPGRVVLDLS